MVMSPICEENPQKRKTARLEPIVENKMTLVTGQWSFSVPMMILPGTDVAFRIAVNSVPIMLERPISSTA